MATSTNARCKESLRASKLLRRAGFAVNTSGTRGISVAVYGGYGALPEGNQTCSSIGALITVPAVGRWEPYDETVTYGSARGWR
jgi:hypothetical protein